ncbi:hypothetical protein OCA16_19470 [Bacillus cereus]|nr:hypothetical protein [Bacillus cereus]
MAERRRKLYLEKLVNDLHSVNRKQRESVNRLGCSKEGSKRTIEDLQTALIKQGANQEPIEIKVPVVLNGRIIAEAVSHIERDRIRSTSLD